MKFVGTGIVLVVLLASALAMPNYFSGSGQQDEAEINGGPYQCFAAPNCAGYLRNVQSKHECCYHVGGMGFWNFATCSRWLVKFHA